MGFESSVSAHIFRVNFHLLTLLFLPLSKEVSVLFFCLFMLFGSVLHLEPNSTVYLWFGQAYPLPPPQARFLGQCPLNFELVLDPSIFLSLHRTCCVLCLCGVLFPAELWQRACSVKQSCPLCPASGLNHRVTDILSWEADQGRHEEPRSPRGCFPFPGNPHDVLRDEAQWNVIPNPRRGAWLCKTGETL